MIAVGTLSPPSVGARDYTTSEVDSADEAEEVSGLKSNSQLWYPLLPRLLSLPST